MKTMTSAQDHKRAGDGDTGLNTGGMGTFSPSPFYTEEIDAYCQKYIFQPTVDAMKAEGRPFKGVIFFGLMLTADGPKVLEYNARFGDPEAQVVLPRMKNDILEVVEACIDGTLIRSTCSSRTMPRSASCWRPRDTRSPTRRDFPSQGLTSLRSTRATTASMREQSWRTAGSSQTAAGCWASRPRKGSQRGQGQRLCGYGVGAV